MHVIFNDKECRFIFRVTSGEARATAILLQKVWSEKQKNGQKVPNFHDSFFEEFEALASSEKVTYLDFNFGHLEFVAAFIGAVAQAQRNEGIDSQNFEKLLELLRPFRTEGMTAN